MPSAKARPRVVIGAVKPAREPAKTGNGFDNSIDGFANPIHRHPIA